MEVLDRGMALTLRRLPSGSMPTILVAVSFLAALLAARLYGADGLWIWQPDIPKIDYPRASFLHAALQQGQLPLWNDDLGLGYPLYAEGPIGAFYPLNWLLFQLPPLAALDLSRVAHLAWAGLGTGLIALRLTGSPLAGILAAVGAALSGGIVTKLEWSSMVGAYGWAPWVLLPLVRRPHPTWPGVAAAGVAWGIQALPGHPNTWLLTGVAAIVLMLAYAPEPRGLLRVVVFGSLGAAVGAVQLIPMALLTTLSVRTQGLSEDDLFTSAATFFDPLGFAFANPFTTTQGDSGWNLWSIWYPDGVFALLEASAYVGLPVLMLAAIGAGARRSRPFLAVGVVMLAIPVVAMFRPDPWSALPILNSLRSPVRSYVLLDLVLVLLAAIGLARLARPGTARRAVLVLIVGAFAYVGVTAAAIALPATFEGLLRDSSTWLPAEGAEGQRSLAVAALTTPLPVVIEFALAVIAAVLLRRGGRKQGTGLLMALAALIPLALFSPMANPLRDAGNFSFADAPFVRAVKEEQPHRLLTLGEPGWYSGMPDQLAAAGVPDIRMFSSLNLEASDEVVERLRSESGDSQLGRALGIDVVVTFGRQCPGEFRSRVELDDAYICRQLDALRPPYWIPAEAARISSDGSTGTGLRPREAVLNLAAVLPAALPASVEHWDSMGAAFTVDAPTDGYVFVDRGWWPAWQASVDGQAVQVYRALGAQLLPVTAGHHRIEQHLVPIDALVGLAIGIVALAAIAVATVTPLLRRRRRSRAAYLSRS